MTGLDGIDMGFPSPLWGGTKGGGRAGYKELAQSKFCSISQPPPLTPPHRGEGDDSGKPEHWVH